MLENYMAEVTDLTFHGFWVLSCYVNAVLHMRTRRFFLSSRGVGPWILSVLCFGYVNTCVTLMRVGSSVCMSGLSPKFTIHLLFLNVFSGCVFFPDCAHICLS